MSIHTPTPSSQRHGLSETQNRASLSLCNEYNTQLTLSLSLSIIFLLLLLLFLYLFSSRLTCISVKWQLLPVMFTVVGFRLSFFADDTSVYLHLRRRRVCLLLRRCVRSAAAVARNVPVALRRRSGQSENQLGMGCCWLCAARSRSENCSSFCHWRITTSSQSRCSRQTTHWRRDSVGSSSWAMYVCGERRNRKNRTQ